MKQAFQMLSGPTVNTLLTRAENRLGQLLATTRPDSEIVEELFWSVLSRAPSTAERDRGEKVLFTASNRRGALEDLAWALVNSKEFIFRR